MNGLQGLGQSRRFWTMVISIVVALVLYFVGKYAGAYIEDVRFVIDLITPLALMLIAAFTIDDIATAWTRAQITMHANALHSPNALDAPDEWRLKK